MDITLRGLTKADIPVWNRLLADIEAVEHSGEHYNEADLLEEMANPEIDPGKDMVGAFDGEEMLGYFLVYPRSATTELHKVTLEGATHPKRRGQGIGTRLAAAMMARGELVHAERHAELPALYTLRGLSANTEQERLLSGIGLEPERWTFAMRADLSEVVAPERLPAALELKVYDASMERALHAAHNAAFPDHPNFTPWSETMWTQWVTESRSFRPELTYVVVDPAVPDQIAAYVQSAEYDAYHEVTEKREAYVSKVGTRREYRGRGIASTLLQHVLVAARQAGYDEASLGVDSANPTGALGVYERAGFTVETRWTDYAKQVQPSSLPHGR